MALTRILYDVARSKWSLHPTANPADGSRMNGARGLIMTRPASRPNADRKRYRPQIVRWQSQQPKVGPTGTFT